VINAIPSLTWHERGINQLTTKDDRKEEGEMFPGISNNEK
jgi:hypothetical protein